MMQKLYIGCGVLLMYMLFTLFLTYLVQQIPCRSVQDPPDWGNILDTTISAIGGGFLEVWRIEPDRPSRGMVFLAQGWSRNRDHMVARARNFGRWGFATKSYM